MRPHRFPIAHLVQLCNTHSVCIGWDMFCHNVHSHFAKEKVCPYPGGCRDASGFNNIQNDFHGKVVSRQLVGVQVICHIHENLVDGVYHDVFRRYVFQIDLVNLCAVLHVICHARRGNNEVYFQRRVCLQFRKEMGFSGKCSSRRIVPSSGVGFLYPLLYFK